MSTRPQTGILAFAAVALAAGAFLWIHERADRSRPALASSAASSPAKPSEAPATNKAPVGSSATVRERPEPEPDPGSPRAGETLEFAADVSKLTNVANLRLQVLNRSEFQGKSAWHLRAFAHTENPLRMIFELDDQFDSFSDAGNFSSFQYEMHLKERGEKVDSVQRMVTRTEDHATPNATSTHVVPGTRDPLGLMQYLRGVDWSKTHEVRSPVYDGHKLYDVRAGASALSQNVAVPAGTYSASKIDIRVFDNGTEMKDARFALYLINNPARTPALLEAVLPFATARVELVSAK
jgi:Protein of unknown function (DUF3108)